MNIKGKNIYIINDVQDSFFVEQVKNILSGNEYSLKTSWSELNDINQERVSKGLYNSVVIKRYLNSKIKRADIILVIIGKNTFENNFASWEIEIAGSNNKRIIGIALQDVEKLEVPLNLKKYFTTFISWQSNNILETVKEINFNLNKDSIYKDIVNKVSDGLLNDAIDIYIRFVQNQKEVEVINDLITLKDRLTRLKRSEKLDIISKSEITIERNKIANTILSLVNNTQINENGILDSKVENGLKVHISYSHRDEPYKVQLEKHLVGLKRSKLIEIWSDREILLGEDWSDEINRQFENADIIIYLISADFLASDYCYSSAMYEALEKHAKGELQIVPILLRECDWRNSPISNIQLLPSNNLPISSFNNQDEGYNNVTINLKNIIDHRFQQTKEITLNINKLESKLKIKNINYEHIEIVEALIDLYKSINKLEKTSELKQIVSNLKFSYNIKNPILVKNINIKGVSIFNDIHWNTQSNINILLGRNGYGKSHLIRLFACILRNEKKLMDIDYKLFNTSLLKIELNQLNKEKITHYNECKFIADIGIVPMLAIPAVRSLYPVKAISPVSDEFTGELAEIGAQHFIHQQPFDSLIQDKLYVFGNELLKQRRSFEGNPKTDILNSPVVKLINETVKELTNNSFEIVSVKDYHGQSRIDIDVITEGNGDPIPIQKASQGTISILSMLLLIYYYLKSLYPDVQEEILMHQKAIVIIDEIDAHLHPIWQRKIIGIFRNNFPHIQFFITAHSPLIVAGCFEREVSVLRKDSNNKFSIFQFQDHFIGADISDIYKRVFEIEHIEYDENYLKLSVENSYTNEQELVNRIETLENKNILSEIEERELDHLHRLLEVRVIQRNKTENNLRETINDLEAKIRSLQGN